MIYVNISKQVTVKEELFKVRLSDMDEDWKEYFLQLGDHYSFLEEECAETLILEVFAKNKETHILVGKEAVAACIESSIQSLLEYEMYEYCSVLRDIKKEYDKLIENDNK